MWGGMSFFFPSRAPTRSATTVAHIAATGMCDAFLPACMSTSGRIHGGLLRFISFPSNKQTDDYVAALGYQPHKQEFCHRRGVFFQQNRGTIGLACAQAVALLGAPTTARRHFAAPRDLPVTLPPLHMAYDDHDRHVSHIHMSGDRCSQHTPIEASPLSATSEELCSGLGLGLRLVSLEHFSSHHPTFSYHSC